MKFSIVLPVFNVEKYIERCLLSLKSQSFDDFELIFVDDCGLDNSIAIVEKHSASNPKIKVVKNVNNLGTYHSRRVGVEHALGEYIVFLDPDDELEPEALRILSKQIHDEPDVVFFGSRRVPAPKLWQSKPEVPILKGNEKRNELIYNITKCNKLRKGTEGKAFNAQFILRVYELLDVSYKHRLIYGEDVLLFAGIISLMRSARSVNKTLYVYHKNDSSITVKNTDIDINNRIQQIHQVVSIINNLRVECDFERGLKKYVICSLELDVLNLRVSQKSSFKKTIFLYCDIFSRSGDIKALIKLMVCFLSLGRVRL